MGNFKQLIENFDFETDLVDKDDNRSSFTWKVSYGVSKKDLDILKQDIVSITSVLSKITKRVPNDESAKDLLKLAKSLQNRISRYIKKQDTMDELTTTSAFVGPQIAAPLGVGPKKKKKPAGYTKIVKTF